MTFWVLKSGIFGLCAKIWASLVAQTVESACSVGDLGLIPALGRSPGEGNGNPFQCSCLGNPWPEEPGRLQSMGSRRVRHDLAIKL